MVVGTDLLVMGGRDKRKGPERIRFSGPFLFSGTSTALCHGIGLSYLSYEQSYRRVATNSHDDEGNNQSEIGDETQALMSRSLKATSIREWYTVSNSC